jgi:hypothetical protein
MPCTICQHPKRPDIDQALLTGSATLPALSQEYGLSTSALHRHKAHLQAKVSRAQNQLQDNLRQGCIFWLSQALAMTMQTAKAAQAEGNSRLVLRALAQGTRLVTIILKNDIPLDDRVVYEILSSPQWAAQDGLLPDDPKIIAVSRQSLAESLSTPCPEGNAPPSLPASPGDLDLGALQALISALDQTPADSAKTPNRLSKRDKSGKSPGKIPFRKDNNQENQEDKLWEEIAGMAGLPMSPNASLGVPHPKLETIFQQWENDDKRPIAKPL